MDEMLRKKRMLGTELEVSSFCLGTAEFGASISKEEAFRQMDFFQERGRELIDTAHVYNDWVAGERARSEKVIGAWMRERRNREHVFISTKRWASAAGNHAFVKGSPCGNKKGSGGKAFNP